MTLKERLRKLLDERGRGAKSRLAEFLGVPLVYITRYAEDEYDDQNLPAKYFQKAADFFNVDVNYFFNDLQHQHKPVKKIPIIGTSSCGKATIDDYQNDNEYAYYNGEYYTPNLYCVIACGDSMSPEIEDGDEIICDPEITVQNGDMVHYTLENESAIKIYFEDEEVGVISFIPYNPSENFRTRSIRIDDNREYKMAKVVAVNKLKFNNRLARLKLIGKA
ncbi:MAG: XRE family transcriptional regulator [Campylobacteraceae bacterium]|jgi:SOS-response transcriptional repressor LexA|nr:XRE family transcriptional regulator [Campylobacteraceae bacterium]